MVGGRLEDGCAEASTGLDRPLSKSSTATTVSPVEEPRTVPEKRSDIVRTPVDTFVVSIEKGFELKLIVDTLVAFGGLCSMSCVRMRMRIEAIAWYRLTRRSVFPLVYS